MRLSLILITLLFLNACSRSPETLTSSDGKTQIQVCFTPGEDCASLLINQINAAQKSIEVQAYSFTSYKIAKALVKAAQRGIDVKIILDKTQFDGAHFSVAGYLQKAGITLYNDNQVVIAHNKVMIIDDAIVETGSYNFTYAAQNKNAENMIIIQNAPLAQEYLSNWNSREEQSQLIHHTILNEK
ncbi:MAG: phospholipase D family protein [Gammaproteobacteria bacterium]|nr:phospholipase D family protein [Gammaproteobacteria bacterium]